MDVNQSSRKRMSESPSNRSATELNIENLSSGLLDSSDSLNSSKISSEDSTDNEVFLHKLLAYLSYEFQITNTKTYNSVTKGIRRFMRNIKNNSIEIEQLRSENTKLQDLLADLKEKSTSTDFTTISSENSYLSTQVQQYTNKIAELKAHMAEILTENKELQDKLSKIENINAEAAEAKLFVTQTDLETLKVKYSELLASHKKTKAKNKELQHKLADSTNTINKLTKDNELAKMQIEKQQLQLDDLQNKKETSTDIISKAQIESKDQQIQSLTTALQELTLQFNELNKDLSTESQIKNQMLVLVAQQSSALSSFEEYYLKISKENSSLKAKIESLQEKTEEKPIISQKSCNHSEIPEKLREFIKENFNSNEKIEQIKDLLSSNDNPLNKIKNVVSFLLQEQNSTKTEEKTDFNQLKQRNIRLSTYIINLTRFIDQISNSAEIQDWLVSDNKSGNFVNDLKKETAKIQSFLEDNKIVDNSELLESFSKFPSFAEKYLNEENFSSQENAELISLLHQFVLSNSVLCKYSEELQSRGRIIMNELKQLKSELARSNDDKNEEIDNIKADYLTKIDFLKHDKELLLSKLSKLQDILRKQPGNNDLAEICLAMIANDENNNEEEEDFDERKYVENLEVKIASLNNQKNREISEKDSLIIDLQNKIAENEETIEAMRNDLENEKSDLVGELESLKIEIVEIKNDLQATTENLEKSKQENEELTKINQLQQDHIEKIDQIKDKEINEQMKKFIDSKMDDFEQIAANNQELTKQLENIETEHKNEIKEIKKSYKQEINRLNSEVEIQTTRANELRTHYDSLLAELRSKLNESRKSESEMKCSYEKMTSEITELKSKLSNYAVEQKMMQVRAQTIDEKMRREKVLMESKAQMEMMSLESSYIAKVNQAKADFQADFDKFLFEICQIFAEYKETEISRENVLELLHFIQDLLKQKDNQMKEVVDHAFILDKIKKMMGLDKTYTAENVFEEFAKIYKEKKEIENSKTEIIKNRDESRELLMKSRIKLENADALNKWEEWAKRIHVLISDNFSIIKSSSELRSCLEDAILSSIGHRQAFRKLQILKFEKELYQSGLIRAGSSSKPAQLNLMSLVKAFSAIQRIQKLSGHLVVSNLSAPKFNSPESKKFSSPKKTPSPKKQWPLFQ